MSTIISTEQAPSAKPISVVLSVDSTTRDLITTVSYEIPVIGFGGGTRVVAGVSEITSPIVLSNTSSNSEKVTIIIEKDGSPFTIANEIPVEPNDIVYIPLNGQFLLSNPTDLSLSDRIRILSVGDNNVTAMVSFTQGQAEEDNPFGEQ